MLHKTPGIVLHTIKYSESSLITKIFTRDFGLQSYIISGIRGKKSKNKATLFQPLAIVDLVVSRSEKGNLQRISEINIHYPYVDIPYNMNKSSIALFLNEILFKAIKEEHPDVDLFEFIKSSFQYLDLDPKNCSNFHICFMVQMSRFLGFYPQGKCSPANPLFDMQEGRYVSGLPNHPYCLNAKQSSLLTEFINAGYESTHLIKMDKNQRRDLLMNLITYYRLHITFFGEIKSNQILEEVIV